MAVLTSQTIWPATHKENQPGAVILVPASEWQLGIASADLIHHPNNGPILFIEKEKIPEMTLKEIKRLNPIGTKDGTQIMVMGDVGTSALEQLKGYKVKTNKRNRSSYIYRRMLIRSMPDITGSHPNSVIIGSSEEEGRLYTTPAVNWISYMPEPLLYTEKIRCQKDNRGISKMRKDKARIICIRPEKLFQKK